MNEAQLGSFLFILPITSLIGLPVSGWLVSKYDSRYPLIAGFLLFICSLIGIGWAGSIELLGVVIAFFAFGMRMINISINTQAIQLQKRCMIVVTL